MQMELCANTSTCFIPQLDRFILMITHMVIPAITIAIIMIMVIITIILTRIIPIRRLKRLPGAVYSRSAFQAGCCLVRPRWLFCSARSR